MKKCFALLLAVLMLAALAIPASAAVTGTFVDEIVDGFDAKVVDFSSYGTTEVGTDGHRIAYEMNQDLGITLLVKQDNNRNPNLTEHITYQMDSNIAGFEFAVLCCAGLGNPLEDISVFISKTGAENSWQQVSTQATKYVYDDEVYIGFDQAYWHNSTLMNKSKIPTGYKYLKIQFNACDKAGDVPWNVAIDTIKITMGSNVAAPTISKEDKFVSYEKLAEQKGSTTTTTTTTTKKPDGATTKKDDGAAATTTKKDDGAAATTKKDGTTPTTISGVVNGDPSESTPEVSAPDASNPDTSAPADGTPGTDNDVPADAPTEQPDAGDAKKGPGALPWIIGGAVVVLAAAGAIVFFVLKKKA